MGKELSTSQVEQLQEVAGASTGVSGRDLKISLNQLTALTPNVFFTDILDTLNFGDNPFDVFVKQDVLFGNRTRYVSTGMIQSQEYALGKTTPETMNSKPAPDYEDFSTSLVKSTYPLIYNEVEMTNYFKNSDNLTQFINQIRAVNNTSYESERLNSFLYLFGNTTADLPQYIKTELDKTKNKIVNTKALGNKKDYKEVFTSIVEIAQDMGTKGKPATNKYNIGFTNGQTTNGTATAKYNKSNMNNDLVLIISNSDLLKLSKEAASIYHQEFYQGTNKFYKVIEADIPAGTAYLLDKETLRVYPKINRTIANEWMDLSMTITSHVFAYWGIFKYGNGIKLTFNIQP